MPRQPFIFGEALFDQFPDGRISLGGAPFNVAWHLKGLQETPLMISRVGDDARGARIIEAMNAWGMDSSAVTIDPRSPTGAVHVNIVDGEPVFSILPDQAYDRISPSIIDRILDHRQPSIIYHGALAVRDQISGNGLRRLIERTDAPVFLDVNLRAPWWRIESCHELIASADWLKCNQQEFERLGLGQRLDQNSLVAARRQWELKGLIVTRGSNGAMAVIEGDSVFVQRSPVVNRLVDSVGAGDAFSSVIILGLLRHWPFDVSLDRAARFASLICGQPGATSMSTAPYRSILGA